MPIASPLDSRGRSCKGLQHSCDVLLSQFRPISKEGCGREGEAEPRRFLRIGLGSANELEYHLLLVRDLRFLSPEDYKRIIGKLIEVKRMLTVLAQKLKAED
jgi:23S rRNA-intervening sequence protein